MNKWILQHLHAIIGFDQLIDSRMSDYVRSPLYLVCLIETTLAAVIFPVRADNRPARFLGILFVQFAIAIVSNSIELVKAQLGHAARSSQRESSGVFNETLRRVARD